MHLSVIPLHIVNYIVEKTEYDSFVKLAQTTSKMSKMCLKTARKIVNPVWKIQSDCVEGTAVAKLCGREVIVLQWLNATQLPCPIHAEIFYFDYQLTSYASRMAEQFKENGTRAHFLKANRITMDPGLVESFLTILDCKKFECYRMESSEYFNCPAVQRLESLLINNAVDITDQQLLCLNASILRLNAPGISNNGINSYLKQWRLRQRTIKDFVIWREVGANDVDEIIDGLNANVVWSPEYHNLTDVNHIDIVQIEPNVRIFSLFHSDNINDVYILYILNGKIRFYQDLDEKYVLKTLDRNEDWS